MPIDVAQLATSMGLSNMPYVLALILSTTYTGCGHRHLESQHMRVAERAEDHAWLLDDRFEDRPRYMRLYLRRRKER